MSQTTDLWGFTLQPVSSKAASTSNQANQPIGIFDSGLGGLTVAR
ncbi:MAG: hypothetical protein RL239_179, partial [Actinomycetota bacterium]